jgi:hypothetical protein
LASLDQRKKSGNPGFKPPKILRKVAACGPIITGNGGSCILNRRGQSPNFSFSRENGARALSFEVSYFEPILFVVNTGELELRVIFASPPSNCCGWIQTSALLNQRRLQDYYLES